jgi:hypothetical protein
MKLYIIYGSETLLLKPLIRQISTEQESFCVRIYNNKIPNQINNFFDLDELRQHQVYPEALNNKQQIGKEKYTFTWRLDTESGFTKFT